MANLFSLFTTLLLLSASSGMMVMVDGAQCKENIAECSPDCKNKCASAHKGGTGLCQPGIGGKLSCWCFYDCPDMKTCQDGFPAIGGCDDQTCDSQCLQRHPGTGSEGYCYDIGDPVTASCRCTYYC